MASPAQAESRLFLRCVTTIYHNSGKADDGDVPFKALEKVNLRARKKASS
jgi:hypothetical protein